MFDFFTKNKRIEEELEVLRWVANRELELLKEVDELCKRKLMEQKSRIDVKRYGVVQREKEPMFSRNFKKIEVRNFRNGKKIVDSCSA